MKKIIITLLVVAMCVATMSVSVLAKPGRPEPPEKPTGTGQAPVCFYVSRWGVQLDTEGNIATRDAMYFSNIIDRTNLNKKMGLTESIVLGENVTEEDILEKLNNYPNDGKVFKKLYDEYKKEGAVLYTNSGNIIDWENFNEKNYGVMWYVLKIENDGWHVDGYVYEIETNDNVNIVLPDEKEDFEELQKEENDNQTENNDPATDEDQEAEVAPGVGSAPLPEEDVESQVDTSIHLRNVKSAYIFGYEPIIIVVTDEETGETYTTAEIEMAMDEFVTREEVCAMLIRTLDQVGNTSGKNFPMTESVKPHEGQWYERGLLYLCSVGGLDTENPIGTSPVTRGEVAKLVSCALKLNLSEETPFTDVDGNPFKEYIEKVYRYGYMQGSGGNRFCPDEIMTRAEFCSLFNNILSRNSFGLTALDENGEEFEITAEDYCFIDMDPSHWAYEICLKATSAYDDDGYVDVKSRMKNIRNIIDRHDAQKEF